jgi:hypothetical protein
MKIVQFQVFPGALRGVPADGGASETLWARIPQMAGENFPLQKSCILFIQSVPTVLADKFLFDMDSGR